MSLVLQMRNERAGLVAQVQALAKIEADGGSLNAEQLQQFTTSSGCYRYRRSQQLVLFTQFQNCLAGRRYSGHRFGCIGKSLRHRSQENSGLPFNERRSQPGSGAELVVDRLPRHSGPLPHRNHGDA